MKEPQLPMYKAIFTGLITSIYNNRLGAPLCRFPPKKKTNPSSAGGMQLTGSVWRKGLAFNAHPSDPQIGKFHRENFLISTSPPKKTASATTIRLNPQKIEDLESF